MAIRSERARDQSGFEHPNEGAVAAAVRMDVFVFNRLCTGKKKSFASTKADLPAQSQQARTNEDAELGSSSLLHAHACNRPWIHPWQMLDLSFLALGLHDGSSSLTEASSMSQLGWAGERMSTVRFDFEL